MLSRRAHNFDVDLEYINTYSSVRALRDPYDAKTNPEGIINFGVAVSGLMDDIWLERMEQIELYKPDKSHFRYYQFWGPDDFLKTVAEFMTRFFKPWNDHQIDLKNLIVLNGALVSFDILGCLLGDDKDVFMCPTPAYSSYFHACSPRWGIEMVIVPMKEVLGNGSNIEFQLTMENIETVFTEEKAKGKTVRAFLLNNPQNPLGKVFPISLVTEIMDFCQRNEMHLIVDEMYCLSVFDTDVYYKSVLSTNFSQFINPDLVHIIWGFSKDLTLTSFRTGVIHTTNEPLKLNLKTVAQLQAVPLPTMEILQNIIKDTEWFENNFFSKNRDRMKSAYLKAKKMFNSMGIKTTCSSAGFFFFVDLRPYINPLVDDNCRELVKQFFAHKVYLTPSWEMRAPLGLFRVVYTVYSDFNDFELGFQRFCAALEEWKLKN